MAADTQVSVEEYLNTVYRPDCDYVDGVIEERHLGEYEHGWIQGKLFAFFFNRVQDTNLFPVPEWRFQLEPTRFRVPDLVVTRGKPTEQILTTPPLLCVEILSPEDTVARVNKRVQEYLAFGVPIVWVIDPRERRVWLHRRSGIEEAFHLIKLDETEVEISFADIFN